MTLETLKDIKTRYLVGSLGFKPDLDMVDRRDVKNLAIKWVKEIKSKQIAMKDEMESFTLWLIWFFQWVHNITEEDLK